MNIIDKDGDILDHIYTSHDRFLEDLEHSIFHQFSNFPDILIDLLFCSLNTYPWK